MKQPDNHALYGIRKGIAIYFNNAIEKEQIKEVIQLLVDITGVTFTGKRAQGEPKIRQVRGGWERVFDNTFKNSIFDSSNVLILTDGTKDSLQTTQIYMNLWNPNKMPSCILVNCMEDIGWDVIATFIQSVNKRINLQFVSAGYDVVSNGFLYPGSAAYSLKFLQSNKYANSEWTEWLNPGFLLAANSGICCPNIIQFLPNQLWARVESQVRQYAHCIPLSGGVLLDILNHTDGELVEPEQDELLDRLSTLYRTLRPIIVPTAKPMFLKETEWDAWQKRYE